MTYQDFRSQMDIKMNSLLYMSYRNVRDAIKRCPAEEQAWMKEWAETLDRLPTMEESEYEAVKDGLVQGSDRIIGGEPGGHLEKTKGQTGIPGGIADPQSVPEIRRRLI